MIQNGFFSRQNPRELSLNVTTMTLFSTARPFHDAHMESRSCRIHVHMIRTRDSENSYSEGGETACGHVIETTRIGYSESLGFFQTFPEAKGATELSISPGTEIAHE